MPTQPPVMDLVILLVSPQPPVIELVVEVPVQPPVDGLETS
jgi:hypothetical protein